MARPSLGAALGIAAALCVCVAVALALFIIDGPETRRALRFDAKRVEDLSMLAGTLDCYWTVEGGKSLPADLEGLVRRMESESMTRVLPAGCRPRAVSDPETGAAYLYRVIAGPQFELCATFALPSETDGAAIYRADSAWRHDAGEHCFRLNAETIDLHGDESEMPLEPLILEQD